MAEVVQSPFADDVFGCDYDVMTSTIRLRQAGCHDVLDSEDMLLEILEGFRARRIVP